MASCPFGGYAAQGLTSGKKGSDKIGRCLLTSVISGCPLFRGVRQRNIRYPFTTVGDASHLVPAKRFLS